MYAHPSTVIKDGAIMAENGKHVILYVDDDADYREALRAILEAEGYSMIEAPTAEDGLATFRESRPDLVIVDLMMEEIDAGTHFVKELRALGSAVPVYMLSSVGDSLTMSTDYASLGLSGVFQKPINRDHLMSVLKSRLG
ncbi:MAG: response regulator [Planctomycetes bacterium]|nr:response regulator [Planctomycetota bacterium]